MRDAETVLAIIRESAPATKTFTMVKAKRGRANHGHHDTGEPGAVISRTPGSEGGRRKRTSPNAGTSLAAYPTARRVRAGGLRKRTGGNADTAP
jgi:hypothetical protein